VTGDPVPASSGLSDSGAAALASRALALLRPGQTIGLGSGHAAATFVRALGAAVRAGLRVSGVPTSEATATLAREVGVPLGSLDEAPTLDITVDGADEVDPALNLIKGYGGALVREKIVAAASRHLVILVGAEKLVPALGAHGTLPVEVVPFAARFCARRLADLGYPSHVREHGTAPVVTDNGNLILDCAVGPITDPVHLDARLRAIPGVVGTGLFIGMAHTVLVWRDAKVVTLTRNIATVGGAGAPS
jgi:ribose 5-phosphate isomerase A